MDTRKDEFIRLINHALEIAEQMKVENCSERLNSIISTLQAIKSQIISGQLEPSHSISTLGLAREVADWTDALDSPLLNAMGAIEQYYQRYFDH